MAKSGSAVQELAVVRGPGWVGSSGGEFISRHRGAGEKKYEAARSFAVCLSQGVKGNTCLL